MLAYKSLPARGITVSNTHPDDIDTHPLIAMLREFMQIHNLTQAEFAGRAGVQEPALSRILSDPTRRPEPETVVALARAMGQSVWAVAVAAGYPFTSPETPSADDERLLRLIQSDPAIRDVLERYYHEVSPERRDSLLRLAVAMLPRQSPE